MNEFSSNPDISTAPKLPSAPRGLRTSVIAVGVVVGLGFGLFAGSLYSFTVVGGIAGAVGGCLAGLFWVTMMKRILSSLWRILGGIFLGIVAGIIATQILWCTLAIMVGKETPDTFFDVSSIWKIATLFFGIPAGAIAGLICGIAWAHSVAGLQKT